MPTSFYLYDDSHRIIDLSLFISYNGIDMNIRSLAFANDYFTVSDDPSAPKFFLEMSRNAIREFVLILWTIQEVLLRFTFGIGASLFNKNAIPDIRPSRKFIVKFC